MKRPNDELGRSQVNISAANGDKKVKTDPTVKDTMIANLKEKNEELKEKLKLKEAMNKSLIEKHNDFLEKIRDKLQCPVLI